MLEIFLLGCCIEINLNLGLGDIIAIRKSNRFLYIDMGLQSLVHMLSCVCQF